MGLPQEVARAELIRNALTTFPSYCPFSAQDINKTIAELTSLCVVINDLDSRIHANPYGRFTPQLEGNVKFMHKEVAFTLDEMWDTIGGMPGNPAASDYQETWQTISMRMRISKNKSVHRVLGDYKRHLEHFCSTLDSEYGSSPEPDPSPLESPISPVPPLQRRPSYRKARNPGSAQKSPILTEFTSMNLNVGPQPSKQRSYERERKGPNRPLSPDSSTSSNSEKAKYRNKPYAPSPPLSPTATVSSMNTSIELPPIADKLTVHWARHVFRHSSSTPLPDSEERTKYHEALGGSAVKELERPSSQYDMVSCLEYPSEHVQVKLMCRLSNNRAKILIEYRDRRGRDDYACLALDQIFLMREGPLLRLCRRKSKSKGVAWATLKFSTFENQILWASTFIAMRSQDVSSSLPRSPPIGDDQLRGEEVEFSAATSDNGYRHALRIIHDRITNAIRLQASALEGEFKRTPVWTAFITHQIMSPEWCRQANSRTICLAMLHPHVFSHGYKPQRAANGAFMIKFEKRDDAEAFLEVLEMLRNR